MWMSRRYLLLGVSFALPFLIANALVALRAKFFLSLIRPYGQPTSFERLLVIVLVALVCVGGVVSLLPILKDRRLYVVNAIVGVAFVVFTLLGWHGLVNDFYHCDVLKIPNCD